MQLNRIIAAALIGVLIVLGACAGPAPTTPAPEPATPSPVPTTPAPTTPAPTTPAPEPTTPGPVPTTPAPTTPAPTIPATPTGPAKFELSNLKITPDRVEVEDVTQILVTVKNVGAEAGTYKAEMKVNGQTYKTQDVTLAGGASKIVIFEYSSKILGDYEIRIGNLSAKLSIEIM